MRARAWVTVAAAAASFLGCPALLPLGGRWRRGAPVLTLGGRSVRLGARSSVDWSGANPLPPWLSHIEEGSPRGVAFVLGQSLRPDGQPSSVLVDRALRAKKLLDDGLVDRVIVSGGDPAGVGRTEASEMAKVLLGVGIREDAIIRESQATTTAENVWFGLRWIPKGTGQMYVVTSDFHMARAMYIFREVLAYFYKTFEDAYLADPRFRTSKDGLKHYPRLVLHFATVASFCGSDPSGAVGDHNETADISTRSLARRAADELMFLGSGEVSTSLYGPPASTIQYIWAAQIDVKADPDHARNYQEAMNMSMSVALGLCDCVSPPERPETHQEGSAMPSEVALPSPRHGADYSRSWKRIVEQCRP